ncbi:hypothetical protein [Piscinibacter sp. XHJ-5]|uniref:hypothetical protein n=1 Tax=Piscinibacter sp. XHJ-5 TaxID=3037797 RepID=UPI0024531C35|nr:hypothetical protein [Piscinibacter sp. XHJ-5]
MDPGYAWSLVKPFLPLLLLPIGIWLEAKKELIWSYALFWRRRGDLIGEWAAQWHTQAPPPPVGTAAPTPAPQPVHDHVCIRWASHQYLVGYGYAPQVGRYNFEGHIQGDAITLYYRPVREAIERHIGVAMLRLENKQLHGVWAQNEVSRPIRHGSVSLHPLPLAARSRWKRWALVGACALAAVGSIYYFLR